MDLKLQSAVIHDDLDAVRDYLDSGCNPNQSHSKSGYNSLLQYAFYSGCMDICEELLNAGAVCQSTIERAIIKNSYLNLKLAIDNTPELAQKAMICLVITKQYEMLKQLLVDYRCDINNRNGCCTALHMAIKVNIYPIVELLLENGANPLMKNGAGENALDYSFKQSMDNLRSEVAQRIYQLIYERTAY